MCIHFFPKKTIKSGIKTETRSGNFPSMAWSKKLVPKNWPTEISQNAIVNLCKFMDPNETFNGTLLWGYLYLILQVRMVSNHFGRPRLHDAILGHRGFHRFLHVAVKPWRELRGKLPKHPRIFCWVMMGKMTPIFRCIDFFLCRLSLLPPQKKILVTFLVTSSKSAGWARPFSKSKPKMWPIVEVLRIDWLCSQGTRSFSLQKALLWETGGVDNPLITIPETNSSHLKIARNPIGK